MFRSQYFLFGTFAAFGLVFLIPALFFAYGSYQKLQTWQTTNGTLLLAGYDGTYFTFNHQGKEMKLRSNFTSSDMQDGDAIEVLYPENNPRDAEIKSFASQWLLPIVFGGFGFVFGLIGAIGLYVQKSKADLKRELKEEGRGRKLSMPMRVERNYSYSVNGQHPWILVGDYHEQSTNTMYRVESANIWYDPTTFVEGKKVEVYVDPNDPSRHYVDVSFLPKSVR